MVLTDNVAGAGVGAAQTDEGVASRAEASAGCEHALGGRGATASQPVAPCVVITGATGGIGRELAREFAQEGRSLALVARSTEKLEALAAELSAEFGVATYAFAADFAQPGAVDALVARVQAAGLVVETLVNNAGFGYDAPFAQSDLARQRALVQTNDMALMELSYAFAPDMAARGHGGILNVASVAGFVPGPYMATYYASKAFVQSFSQALRVELKPYGVHVTALCPGPVRTPFWDNADAGSIALARLTVEAPRVARAAVRALGANKPLCCPGLLAKGIVAGSRFVPRTLAAHAAAALQRK